MVNYVRTVHQGDSNPATGTLLRFAPLEEDAASISVYASVATGPWEVRFGDNGTIAAYPSEEDAVSVATKLAQDLGDIHEIPSP